jgi:hypothetical protein
VALLRQPVIDGVAPGEPLPPVLAGVRLRRGAASAARGGIEVRGGVRVDRDGWYTWLVEPSCPAAHLTIDDQPAGSTPRPLLAGVHAFELTIPDRMACPLPLRLVQHDAAKTAGTHAVLPRQFVAPRVALDSTLRAAPVTTWEGYGAPHKVMQIQGRPVDFGVDGQGNFSVLAQEQGTWRVRRYDEAGAELAAWELSPPLNYNLSTLAVAPDGTTAVPIQQTVTFYDQMGKPVGAFQHPWIVWESHFEFWGNDLLVANIPHRNSLVAFDRRGEVVAEVTTPDGAPASMYSPMGVSISEQGDMLVPQADGVTLRLRLDGPGFAPRFVAALRAVDGRPGGSFDGRERMLVPNGRTLLVMDGNGGRQMAADPRRDPSQQGFGRYLRARRAAERLYLLDSDRSAIWMLHN